MSNLQIIYFIILGSSAIIAYGWRKHLSSRKLIIFVPYLVYVFIQEFTLITLTNSGKLYNTYPVYNIYTPLSAVFFYFFFFLIPYNIKSRKIIFPMLIIYLIITLITLCFFTSMYNPNSYLNSIRALIITLCGLFTLYNYFNLDNPEQEKHWLPATWICIGITVFYPVVNISNAFRDTLYKHEAKIFGEQLYAFVPKVMSIFMYSCFIYAFYLCKKKNWTLSSQSFQ